MVDGKLCKRCNQFVLYPNFYKWKLGKDGYADWCKACRSSHDKTVYPETKVRFNNWLKTEHGLAVKRQSNISWKRANPDKRRYSAIQYSHRRRAKMYDVEFPLTKQQWLNRLQEFNNHCAYCNEYCDKLEQEHMQPVSRGGKHSEDNVIPACPSCNRHKAHRTLLEFVQISTAESNPRLGDLKGI